MSDFFNGFMLDSARCQENRAYYRAFIDFAADRGARVLLWHFTDDQGCSLEFDAIPELASPNAYTKTEMRELIRYAAGRGVELVPELASLGHCLYLTRLPEYRHLDENATGAHFTGMCPVSDDTRRTIATLLAEVADVFTSPNVHVGLDEVNIGGHPLTRDALKTQSAGAILGDYVAYLHGVCTKLGKRMWMWGDGLLKDAEMMARVPRDVVICNWQYTPAVATQTTQTLLDAGFDVLLCSALTSHDQTLFPGERFAAANVRALDQHRTLTGNGRVIGHLATIWTPVRFIADSLWLGIDLAAATLRGETDRDASIANFARAFYGLPPDEAGRFVGVAQLLCDESPTRDEWVPIAKLDALSPATLARATALAPHWSRAAATLRAIEPAVASHPIEFRAFSLLLDVLAHAYEAAVLVADRRTSPATLDRIAAQGASIVDRVDRAWDRERFATDTRKRVAPIPSFQDDHLLPLLETGLARLANRAADARREVVDRPASRDRKMVEAAAG